MARISDLRSPSLMWQTMRGTEPLGRDILWERTSLKGVSMKSEDEFCANGPETGGRRV
jgi:hypothetical protein